MPLNLSAVGTERPGSLVAWDSTRAIVYALGVGAGQDDPQFELEYTTEDSIDLDQLVLPTFPMALSVEDERQPWNDGVPTENILHAEQTLVVHHSLPVTGSAMGYVGVGHMYDKGTGALVELTHRLVAEDGTLLAESVAGSFVRGEGGFGGDRGPSEAWRVPDRPADAVVEQATMPWQALLFRLSYERNPLHTDPEFAALGGFDRPILQGACTFGFAGRALLHTFFDGDPDRFGSMSARFAAPVIPGDVLRTSIWMADTTALFVTHTANGTLVLDRGRATVRP